MARADYVDFLLERYVRNILSELSLYAGSQERTLGSGVNRSREIHSSFLFFANW